MILITIIVIPLLFNAMSIHSMEHHAQQLQRIVTQKKASQLMDFSQDITTRVPSSASMMRNGKTAVQYLACTALPQLAAGLCSNPEIECPSNNFIADTVMIWILGATVAVTTMMYIKETYQEQKRREIAVQITAIEQHKKKRRRVKKREEPLFETNTHFAKKDSLQESPEHTIAPFNLNYDGLSGSDQCALRLAELNNQWMR